MSGPVPKRSDQRRRVNKPEVEIDHAPSGDAIDWPEPDPSWHPIASRFYEALRRSGQSAFFQLSDVAMAFYTAEIMNKTLGGKPNANLVTAVVQLSGSLLATEGDRRRLRIELARNEVIDEDEEASVASLDRYRRQIGG